MKLAKGSIPKQQWAVITVRVHSVHDRIIRWEETFGSTTRRYVLLASQLPTHVMFAQAASTPEQMHVYTWEWFALGGIALVLILIDLFGHVRKAHEPTLKEAGIWSAFYIAIALLFGLTILWRHGGTLSGEYYGGYAVEKALSVDNIFVFIIVIASFKVPRKYQQKVLLYGIVIALILRLIFILLGKALIDQFVWVFFIFGAFLLYTAISQLRQGVDDPDEKQDEIENYKPNAIVRFAEKHMRVTEGFVGQKLVTRREGKTWITPLFLCIVAIGTVDLMFALDSIPAIYGLTNEPYIVFSANVFALLGLRQLYFLVDGLLEKLVYLHYGLAAILGFIAVKLIIHAFHGYDMLLGIPEPSIGVSLGFILTVITITVVTSLRASKKRDREKAEAQPSQATFDADSDRGEISGNQGAFKTDDHSRDNSNTHEGPFRN